MSLLGVEHSVDCSSAGKRWHPAWFGSRPIILCYRLTRKGVRPEKKVGPQGNDGILYSQIRMAILCSWAHESHWHMRTQNSGGLANRARPQGNDGILYGAASALWPSLIPSV